MKRLPSIIGAIVLLLTLSGCEKVLQPKSTTYTFQDNLGVYKDLVDAANTSKYKLSAEVEFQFIEYYERNRVNVQTLKNPEKGKKYSFTANEKSEYLTVLYHSKLQSIDYPDISSDRVYYSAVVYYLKSGDNLDMVLDESTMISSTEPIK